MHCGVIELSQNRMATNHKGSWPRGAKLRLDEQRGTGGSDFTDMPLKMIFRR